MGDAELRVEARAHGGAPLGRHDGSLEVDRVQVRAEKRPADDRHVVDRPAIRLERERCLPAGHRSAQVGAEHAALVVGRVRREGIARVQRLVVEVERDLATEVLGAGLRQDLDPAVAGPIELGREGAAVQADLADRRLRRHPASGEAVDVDLPAARSGGGPGQRLERLGQLVRVVGQRFEVAALDQDGAGSRVRRECERRLLLAHDDGLLDRREIEIHVEPCGSPRRHGDFRSREGGEAGLPDQDRVPAWRQPVHHEGPACIGCG